MQNKGFIKVVGVALILVCAFYLSFSIVTNRYENKAQAYAQGDNAKYKHFMDSVLTDTVFLNYTLKECREKEMNLGLDLKGGMNVILEISVPDIVKALSNDNQSESFKKAIALATERQKKSQSDFLTLFEQAYKETDPNGRLSAIFSSIELKDKIQLSSSNADVMKVLREEVDGAVSNSFNVLRTRIDRFGVVQPNIQKLENSGRILVEMPGVKEPERVHKLLQGTANLEFWETYKAKELAQNFMAADNLLKELVVPTTEAKDTAKAESKAETAKAEAPKSLTDSLAAAMKTEQKEDETTKTVSKAELEKRNPLLAILNQGVSPEGAVVGIAHYSDTAKINRYMQMDQVKALFPADLSLKWGVKAIDKKDIYYELFAIKSNRNNKAPLEGNVITSASTSFGEHSAYASVSMQMNPEGANIWAQLTDQNVGRCIAIVLDGYVYSAPVVNGKIPGGRSEISGRFTIEDAKDLVNVLQSGKMPAPVRIVQEDVVGPSLGKEAIESGFFSFIIAFAIILLYMLFFYGKIPGLVADCMLIFNIFFLLGILASFKAVLTLPGIAGIVLTMGMAIDTNVLIYERIREELRSGKTLQKAVTEGYSNASSAIIDANLTTILTGVILFIFGTGPIKGFATTLIIGIVTSLLTGFVFSRLVFDKILSSDKNRKITFETKFSKSFLQNVKIDFIGKRKIAYIISATLIIVSIASFAIRGFNNGIDFSGGRNYMIRFDKNVKTEEVKNMLAVAFDGHEPSVITIKSGNVDDSNNRVRISTNFKIDNNDTSIDSEIIDRLYAGLKPLLKEGTTREEFSTENIMETQKVGPTIADDIKKNSVWAVLAAIIGIGLYILIRFRNIAFSVGGILSLAHDAILILGAYSLFYGLFPFALEINQAFIAAILTVLGYSINDTVVIFDRVREYQRLYPKRNPHTMLNDALNSTLVRTFNTTFTTAIVLVAIFIFGGDSIRDFIFALLIGIIIGTYSSLFVAIPAAYEIAKRKVKTKKEA
jgi:SecD/SecF fusion protein